MVRLTSIRTEIDPRTGKAKAPWWKLNKFTKINLFMVVAIATGLWSFVQVRDNVMAERKQQMKFRKEIENKVKKEVEEEAEKAGPNAKIYNV